MSSVTGSIGSALARWVRFVLRFRKLVILLAFAAAALSVQYSAGRLGINTDTANMISDELPWRQHFIDFRENFAVRDRNIVVVIDASTPERADAFSSELIEKLSARPELFRSVFTAGAGEFFERNGLLYLTVSELEDLADRLAAAQPLLGLLQPQFTGADVVDVVGRTVSEAGEAGQEPVAGMLYSELGAAVRGVIEQERDPVSWRQLTTGAAAADESARRIVVLQPELDFDRVQPAAEAVTRLRNIVDELAAELEGVSARLTGAVAMEHEEMLSVRRGAGLAGLASLFLVSIVLYAALRSWKLLAISIVTLIVGLTGTAAFAAGAVGHLNLLSVAFAVLYVGLGVDFIIHICLRLKELTAAGMAVDDAIAETVTGVGTSLVICAVTTAAGFYAFIPTDFEGVSELGLISGTGMFISLFVSVTLLPALLGQFLSERDRPSRPAWIGTGSLATLTSRPRIVLVAGAAIVVVASSLLPGLRFDSNPVNLRDPDSESVRALQDLAADSEAPLFNLVAVARDHETALEWAARLRPLDTVSRVTTVESLVPPEQDEKLLVLDDIELLMGSDFAALERTAPEAARLEQSLVNLQRELRSEPALEPSAGELEHIIGVLLDRLNGATETQQRQILDALDEDIAGGLPAELERLDLALEAQPFDRAELPETLAARWIGSDGRELVEITPAEDVTDNAALRRFADSVREVVPTATGLPVVYQEASRTVVQSFQLALLYALIIVTILLFVFLQRAKDVLLVIAPILLAAVVTAGAAVLFGIPFNFANIIALPLLVGIGVDNGIHIVHRVRTAPPADGQLFGTSTSVAMLASYLTTIASFGNLGFSAHQGMASMGQLLTIGMIVTLAATLVFLPALLKLRSAA